MPHSSRAPAPYGSWRSPISAAHVARAHLRLSEPWLADDGCAYWLESRPDEDGRNVLVRRGADGIHDVVPAGFDVRTRVHEYGGGAWLLAGQVAFCSRFDDQRLYRIDPGGRPRPITPVPEAPGAVRYADGRLSPDGALIVCVRESAAGGAVVNDLVAVAADGSTAPVAVATGRDFYSTPRISPDGRRLAWLEWDHPRMPWIGTELYVAELLAGGTLGAPRLVAGGARESIWQPEWSPAGVLHYVSDRSGWWNLYRETGEAVVGERAEVGFPQWALGGSTYAFTASGEIVCIRIENAVERLCRIVGGRTEALDLPYTAFRYFPYLRTSAETAIFVAASPTAAPAVLAVDLETDHVEVLRSSTPRDPDPRYVSTPRAIAFPSEGGRTAHAFYYPPANADFVGPADELPPLIVAVHGGPTVHNAPELSLSVLYWTSRGFGVVDVNFGGSTGFGRAYREQLDGNWGITDTADCIAAARHLAEMGEADGERLAIHGGSGGGYTTLCALVFHDVFGAGACSFGVADAETLARDTHKFESRYLETLIGPYPEARATYVERSPIHHLDQLRTPLILFHGLDDKIAPASQSEAIAAALRRRGIPHAYVAFEGEGHGFRRAESIIRCHETELSFYGRIFGFVPAD